MSGFLLRDCVVLLGQKLTPWRCSILRVEDGGITEIRREEPVTILDDGAIVVMPSMCNGHTHMGDSCLPDGATGLTLEEGFFRPNGYKYRELGKRGDAILPHLQAHLHYMAQTGTTLHLDFRESGAAGAKLLRTASEATGVDSVILGQFTEPPFSSAELEADAALLPSSAIEEAQGILAIADGLSESTMNDLTTPAWKELRELTDKTGKLRAIHCLENNGYREVSLARTGKGDLSRALELYDPDLIVHLTVANTDEIALLAASGKTAVINPRANANLGLPFPPVRALLEAGVNLLLGTDNGMLNSPNLFAELDFTYKLAKSQYGDALRPEPASILRMVTSNAGTVLAERFPGYLEEGMPANLCLLDFHAPQLRHTRHIIASILTRVTPLEVLATMCNGKILYQKDGYEIAA